MLFLRWTCQFLLDYNSCKSKCVCVWVCVCLGVYVHMRVCVCVKFKRLPLIVTIKPYGGQKIQKR